MQDGKSLSENGTGADRGDCGPLPGKGDKYGVPAQPRRPWQEHRQENSRRYQVDSAGGECERSRIDFYKNRNEG